MYYFRIKSIFLWSSLLSFVLSANCANTIITKENYFLPPHQKYLVHIPNKGWEQIQIDKEDVSLRHKQSHATITILSSVIEHEKLTLEVLNTQLFLGIKDKKVLLKLPAVVNNRTAMHTMLTGKIDTYTIKIDSYIVTEGKTVYDLVYWAPEEVFDSTHSTFEEIIQTFQFTQKNIP
ncbi:MAG: hypothetical protein MRJ65_00385 [Candidatus Brocadiaceae bacterium]|nr:hypothetical protein [Candidatus Brocadiaceae bacterium]